MAVLSDKWIRKMALEHQMISPFEDKQIRGNKISFGLSSFGYDARVSNQFKIFTDVNSAIVDPKLTGLEKKQGGYCGNIREEGDVTIGQKDGVR